MAEFEDSAGKSALCGAKVSFWARLSAGKFAPCVPALRLISSSAMSVKFSLNLSLLPKCVAFGEVKFEF